jgi:hypothetical protein
LLGGGELIGSGVGEDDDVVGGVAGGGVGEGGRGGLRAEA